MSAQESYYEVDVIIDGAFEHTEDMDSLAEAEEFAAVQAAELSQADVTDWQVYIYPHTHGRNFYDCACRQYDTSHLPTYSSSEE